MKTKLVLFLLAAMGSTALMAPAQTPNTYVITTTRSEDALAPVPVPPAPPGAPVLPPPGAAAPEAQNRDVFYGLRPHVLTYSVAENHLSRQAEQLGQQLASARSDSDREKIKGQLTELLGKQFDQRQKRHEEEIKQLETQLKKLKDLVDKRQENRREIIARRLDQIVKESQGLGW